MVDVVIAEAEVIINPRTASGSKLDKAVEAFWIVTAIILLPAAEAEKSESKFKLAQVATLAVAEEPEVTCTEAENWLVE